MTAGRTTPLRAALLLAIVSLAALAALAAAPLGAAGPAEPAPVKDPALASWIGGWFAWGDGEVTLTKAAVAVPGWTAYHADKKFAAPFTFEDRIDVLLSADGKSAIVGAAFTDVARAAAGVTTNADLDGLRDVLKRLLPTVRARPSLDPAHDVPGFRALAIAIPTGYGDWRMGGYLSAADGSTFVMGRLWRRDRSIPEQRREAIDQSAEPVEGPADAKLTMVEYSDMQCPMCKRRSRDLPELLEKLKKDLPVRRVLKTYPLTEIHPWSFRAASAARCLFLKDPKLFFSFRSNVFARQEQLEVSSLDAFVLDFAQANGVLDDVRKCWLSDDDRVLADLAEGFAMGVRSTPTFFVDGVQVVWFDDPFMEEFLRKTYLGGKGLPIRTPAPVKTPEPPRPPKP